MTVTIYHNPNCGTSRKVLEKLQEKSLKPHIVEYLKTPFTKAELKALIGRMNVKPQDVLRRKGELYAELGLDKEGVSEDIILEAMVTHPALIERPIVVTDSAALLCRPAERVNELLS